ncbi:transcription initiation factor TFIID subunit 8-like isoform X2 [Convolutriloba macropyga]|uniref:transcription initiation factor TFIID subunit 8-like isoform X2 n=1 Tax=Convolutriloba macropyga TaxID=536237 RepID=UPI003F528EBB
MCAYHESDLDKSLLCISACVLKAINVRNVSSGFIETLGEILKVFISKVGKESRRLSEHANRQGIIADDILAALISLGFSVTSLPQYYQDVQQECLRSGGQLITLSAPDTEQQPTEPNRLKIGSQIDKPPFIPGYMLPLPEAHTFTETRTFSRVNDNYKNSRENYSEQSRNSDTALISIHLNSFSTNANMTGLLKNQTLFHSDPNQFQLLAPEERGNLQSFHAVLEQSEIPEVPSARAAVQSMASVECNSASNPFVQKLSRLKCFPSDEIPLNNNNTSAKMS